MVKKGIFVHKSHGTCSKRSRLNENQFHMMHKLIKLFLALRKNIFVGVYK